EPCDDFDAGHDFAPISRSQSTTSPAVSAAKQANPTKMNRSHTVRSPPENSSRSNRTGEGIKLGLRRRAGTSKKCKDSGGRAGRYSSPEVAPGVCFRNKNDSWAKPPPSRRELLGNG